MVKETEQIKRMKELSLNSVYSCCGEIYRLFSYENLPKLIKKIKMGEVKLNSTLLYGRDIITSEERFLENLNKYIGYVRDHYFVNHIEQFCLIETSLTNKYTKCLFELKDYHVDENYEYYHDMFRKMFMFNFYDNIFYFSNWVDEESSIKKFVNKFKDYNFNDKKDILEIEKEFIKIIANRKDNFINAFLHHSKMKERDYNFYICQIEWVLDDTYKEEEK